MVALSITCNRGYYKSCGSFIICLANRLHLSNQPINQVINREGRVKTSDLTKLAQAVEQLISRNAELKQQCAALTQAEKDWQQERAQLINKNEVARQKVEAMIFRLKALERDS